MITIKEVSNNSDLSTFIYLPEKIHANHKNWLHPLYIDEKKFFSKEKNPAFKHNETIMLLAYKNNEVVGRIMGIIPMEYNIKNNIKCVRFSYFECYNDYEIFNMLIEYVEKWGKSKGCNEIIGPMGFSDKEPQGFLTDGFDKPTMLITNCSFYFMKDYIKQANYQPFIELFQYNVPLRKNILDRYSRFSDRIENRLKIKINEFTKTSQIRPFVNGVFELINDSYKNIYGFVAVTQKEIDEFANRFLPLLNPKLIKIITNENDKVVAFVVAMADLSNGIRKAKGRLFPLGWLHILKSSRQSKTLMLLLGSISPSLQGKGIDAVLATYLFSSAIELGFKEIDSHLIMKENVKMRNEIERLPDYKLYKKYMIFRKDI